MKLSMHLQTLLTNKPRSHSKNEWFCKIVIPGILPLVLKEQTKLHVANVLASVELRCSVAVKSLKPQLSNQFTPD